MEDGTLPIPETCFVEDDAVHFCGVSNLGNVLSEKVIHGLKSLSHLHENKSHVSHR